MGKKTGELICQARTKAKLSQAQLAKIVSLTTGEIKKAEAGDLDLPQSFLRAIAKATGVTQVSLINAEKPPKPKATKKPVGTPMLLTAQEKKVCGSSATPPTTRGVTPCGYLTAKRRRSNSWWTPCWGKNGRKN